MTTELLEALTERDLDRVRALARTKPELVQVRGDDGVLPAVQALYAGEAALGEELLPADEELEVWEAAAFGRLGRLESLLEQDDALARAWSPDGFTPLSLAIFGGDDQAVRMLIAYGADLEAESRHPTIRVRPLHTAAFVRDPRIGKILLEAGADVNGTAEGGCTALHSAAQNRDVAFARLLLEYGADPEVEYQGRRPVDFADESGAAELAALLRSS